TRSSAPQALLPFQVKHRSTILERTLMVRALLAYLARKSRAKMTFVLRTAILVSCCVAALAAPVCGQDKYPASGPPCNRNVDDYFAKEVWTKVASALCVNCHKVGGDAEGSRLILEDPRKAQGHAQDEAMKKNQDAFCRLA